MCTQSTLSLSLGNRLCVCWICQVQRRNRDVLTFYINRLARVSCFSPRCCCCPTISTVGSCLRYLFLPIHPPLCHEFERPMLRLACPCDWRDIEEGEKRDIVRCPTTLSVQSHKLRHSQTCAALERLGECCMLSLLH